MPEITFILSDGTEKEVDAENGMTVMEVAVKNNIESVEGACGGSLACATCHLYVHPDWWNKALPEDEEISEDEEDMLDLAFDIRDCSRLTCQIEISDDLDGLVLAVPGADVEWAA